MMYTYQHSSSIWYIIKSTPAKNKCGNDNDDKRPHKCEQPMRKESNVQN